MLLTLVLFVGLSVPLLCVAHAANARRGAKVAARARRIREGWVAPAAGRQARSTATMRRRPTRTVLGGAGHRLARLLPRSEMLRRRLDQAGARVSVADFAMLCLLAAGSVGALARLGLGAPLPLAIGFGLLAGTGLPRLWLGRRAAKRKRDFAEQFPDAIDLIVRGVKSGLPVTESLQSAGEELPNHVGTLFQEVTGSIKLGKSLDEALLGASRGMPLPELRFFVISLAVQQETGGNLAEILQNLAGLMRRRTQVKLKIRAMSSEARASATIIGSLPFAMFGILYLVDPSYALKLFADPRGWMLLAAALVSLGVGLAVMAKMVQFEI